MLSKCRRNYEAIEKEPLPMIHAGPGLIWQDPFQLQQGSNEAAKKKMPILPNDTTANSRCRSTSRLLTKSNNHLNPPRPDGYNGFFVMTLVIVGQKMLSKDTPNNQKKKTPPWRSNFLEKRRKEKNFKTGRPGKTLLPIRFAGRGGQIIPENR